MPTKQPKAVLESAPPVRAFTVRQPRAASVLLRPGPHELPGWGTDYRGPLLIHADRRGPGDPPAGRAAGGAYGALLGVVELTDCVANGRDDGDADEVGYVWILANPRPFGRPIPYAGRPGLFEVAYAVVAAALARATG